MTTFRYTAIGAGGERLAGVMDAATEAEVIARLQRQGAMPVRAEPADKASRWSGLLQIDLGGRRGLRKQDVADLIRELATMLTAGQDLDRALRYMQETAPARTRPTITGLRDAVRDGSPLSVAMARYPTTFPAMHVGLVRAGEAGGNLGPTLARIADLLDRQRALASTVTSALIYPAVLFLAMIGAVTLLLTQVLPQFVPMFEQSGVPLPASTQFLIAAGNFVQADGVFLLLALVVLIFMARAVLRQPRLRLVVDRITLRLPVIGGLMKEILAARFTRVLGTLLLNGVALIPALAIVRDAMGNVAARTTVERASLTARGGGSLTRDLEAAGVFPARTIHLLRLGEETAQLAPMALRAADIHEEKTRLATQRLTSLLVPAMTILMGVAVGGIVASLMTAMLSLNNLASG
ncbi:MAG TPA: type II secretion system F family protein [Rhodopila sp.]|jgi:general secretion pathway protein F|nr:type II secretion system F family protein [Rhodopila sp.]